MLSFSFLFSYNNIFILNYWSDHTNTDANGDGIADEPYYLGGNTGNADNFPLVDLVSEQSPTHVMTIPSIIYPVSGITLSGVEEIKWKKLMIQWTMKFFMIFIIRKMVEIAG